MFEVIGIVGLHGSGKTEVAKTLAEFGVPSVLMSYIVSEEVRRRGQKINESTVAAVANELRKRKGLGAIARHEPMVEVTFSIDANGILNVKAVDSDTGRKLEVKVAGVTKLPREEMQRMIREAAVFADVDEKKREEIEVRNRAWALLYEAERMVEEGKVSINGKMEIERAIERLREALEEDDTKKIKASIDDFTGLAKGKQANALISLAEKFIGKLVSEEREEIEGMVNGLKWALRSKDLEEIERRMKELFEALTLIDVPER